MPKATSPIRLQRELMEAATLAAVPMHRSATEQVEYWASIGRQVARLVDTNSLLAVITGNAQLKIEPIIAPVIKPDDVFTALENDRAAGELATSITTSTVRYQASAAHPGLLDQINPDGKVISGEYRGGKFIPIQN